MIVYKCDSCGAKLETDDSLSGKQEVCPSCQKVNCVPLSKNDREEHLRREKERKRQDFVKRQEEQNQRQRELETQMRAAEEERQQGAAEERAQRHRVQQQRFRIENEKAEQSLRMATKADRFLRFSFKLAKTISVVIVGTGLLVVIGCLVCMAMVRPEVELTPPPPSIPKVTSPQFSTLQAALEAKARGQTSSYRKSSKRDLRVPIGPWYNDRLHYLSEDFSLKPAHIEMIETCLKVLEDRYQKQFLNGLEEFLVTAQKYISRSQGQLSIGHAVNWYKYEFMSAIDARNSAFREAQFAERTAREARIAAELGAKARRGLLLFIIIGAVCAMLAFLILPLMIQIEHNTRILLVARDE